MQWSIGKKIGTSFALAVAIMALVGSGAYLALNKMSEADAWQLHTSEVLGALSDSLSLLQDMETGQRGFIITGEDRYLEPYNNGLAQFDQKVSKLQQLTIDNPAQQRRIELLKTKAAEKKEELAATIALRRDRGFAAAYRVVAEDKGKKVMDEIRTIYSEMQAEEESLMARRSGAAAASAGYAKVLLLGGTLIMAVFLTLAGLALSRGIAGPVLEISVIASRIASGDLSIAVPASDKTDEIGVLEKAFRTLSGNLRRNISEIAEAVNLLGSSSGEILAATTQVATSAAENATAVSETTTTVEEVRQAAQLSSQKAKNVSENSQALGKISQNGLKAVDENSAAMNRIQAQMESIAKTIVNLGEQTQSIGGIIAAITDIADQCNLLAVNAGIEAAKAGEQGRGFAVVAQELRSLAEQSKQGTSEVRRILNDVQKATNSAILVTEQGTNTVEAGVRQAALAGEAIRALTDSTSQAVQAAIQIAASSQQQGIGMDQIGKAMENVNQATTENMASMKQTEAAAKIINELGQKLKHLVSQYKM